MSPELIVVPIVVALVTAGGTYLAMRRKSSGSVATSDAEVVFAASQAFQTTMLAEIARFREEMAKLTADYVQLDGKFKECERSSEELKNRLKKIEVDADAAKIVEAAKVEAAKIRAEAKLARREFLDEMRSATKAVTDAKDASTKDAQDTKDVVTEESQHTREVVVEEGQTTRDELGGGGDE